MERASLRLLPKSSDGPLQSPPISARQPCHGNFAAAGSVRIVLLLLVKHSLRHASLRYVASHPELDRHGKTASFCVGCRLIGCCPLVLCPHTHRAAMTLRCACESSLLSLLSRQAGDTSVFGRQRLVKMPNSFLKFSEPCAAHSNP
jgi:hypothetical protein